jgi:hypothetical protein
MRWDGNHLSNIRTVEERSAATGWRNGSPDGASARSGCPRPWRAEHVTGCRESIRW